MQDAKTGDEIVVSENKDKIAGRGNAEHAISSVVNV